MEPLNTINLWMERARDRPRAASFGRFLWRRFLDDRLFQAAAALAYTTVFALVLSALHASWAPWPDAWIFVGTALAFWAQARGLVDFWFLWLAVDAVGVPLQLASGLWFSAAIYLVFVALVVHGWWSWHRTARARPGTADSQGAGRV